MALSGDCLIGEEEKEVALYIYIYIYILKITNISLLCSHIYVVLFQQFLGNESSDWRIF